ncbi:hypothetical protein SEA_AELIN_90 [Mycobacterium phage Aelin]|uniref:Uncharacterized protein n=1 Tax=Mycobacterium phage Aelin TaxID=2812935 RepID=A0A899ING0_9CAUD|nr:hypothetical protein SEA_AELIN_90 [Mycobacterium phage Aelin]
MGLMPNLGGLDVAKTVGEFKDAMITMVTLLRETNRKLDTLIEIEQAKATAQHNERPAALCLDCEDVGRLLCHTHGPAANRVWEKIQDVPEGVYVRDIDGATWHWEGGELYEGNVPWGTISSTHNSTFGPFTEVANR